jgi:hypothetical protein
VSPNIEVLIRHYHVGHVCFPDFSPITVTTYRLLPGRQKYHHHGAQCSEYAYPTHPCETNAIRAQCTPLGAKQVHALLRKLQQIAKDAGHERPLMIGTDQENG